MNTTTTITGKEITITEAFGKNGFGSLAMPEVEFTLDQLTEEEFQALLAND